MKYTMGKAKPPIVENEKCGGGAEPPMKIMSWSYKQSRGYCSGDFTPVIMTTVILRP